MNPVQPPQHICTEVNRGLLAPVFIHVLCHMLDKFWYKIRTDRMMFAPDNLDACRTICPSESGKSFEGSTIKAENCRGPQFEWALRMEPVFNLFSNGIKLFEAVADFFLGLQ